MTQTPAGWYPDPYGSPQLRWWDGGQWTDATHVAEAVPKAVLQAAAPAQGGDTVQLPVPDFGARPPRRTGMWPWVLGGGGAAIAIILVLVGTLYLFDSSDTPTASEQTRPPAVAVPEETSPAQPSPEATDPVPEATPTTGPTTNADVFPKPSGGRITDPVSGLSYAYPGRPWTVAGPSPVLPGDPASTNWSSGYQTISQKDYQPGDDWMGTVMAGPLPAELPYHGPDSLRDTLGTYLLAIERNFYSPPHERRILADKAMTVSGKKAWLLEFEMDFSQQAKINGWKWKKEHGALILVDRGDDKPPSLLYATIPDNLDTKLLDKVIRSVKAP
ncbi:MAG TPA: DUF2510 domain-containing protein [Thermopolyspora sp.]